MQGSGRDGDPALMRVSDQERHAVAEVLRQAAGEGRIDLDELDERLASAYGAKTYAELVPLTADLPVHPPVTGVRPAQPAVQPAPVPAVPPAGLPSWGTSFAMMAETKRQGQWLAGAQHNAVAVMGSVVLDLRQAHLGPELVITAVAVMGSVEVLVDARTRVVVDGLALMGDFNEVRSKVQPVYDAASPLVRVRGLALMGAVNVKRKGPPGEQRRRMLGH